MAFENLFVEINFCCTVVARLWIVFLSYRESFSFTLKPRYVGLFLFSPSDDLDSLALKSPSVSGLSPNQIYAVIEYKHTFKLFLQCLETVSEQQIILEEHTANEVADVYAFLVFFLYLAADASVTAVSFEYVACEVFFFFFQKMF